MSTINVQHDVGQLLEWPHWQRPEQVTHTPLSAMRSGTKLSLTLIEQRLSTSLCTSAIYRSQPHDVPQSALTRAAVAGISCMQIMHMTQQVDMDDESCVTC